MTVLARAATLPLGPAPAHHCLGGAAGLDTIRQLKCAAERGRGLWWNLVVSGPVGGPAEVADPMALAAKLAHLEPPHRVTVAHPALAADGEAVRGAVERWRGQHAVSRFTATPEGEEAVRLVDSRGGVPEGERVLFDWRAAVYLECARPRTAEELAALRPLARLGRSALEGFLAWCVDRELTVEHGGRHLALAVSAPAPAQNQSRAAGRVSDR